MTEYERGFIDGIKSKVSAELTPTLTNVSRTMLEMLKPVKRGRWIDEDEFVDIKVCSVCRKEAYWDTDYGQQLFHFCPNCGARMDGDTECK